MRDSLIRLQSLWIVIPPILLCCLDFALTLYGQSPAYWAGNYQAVNEISPSFRWYLETHPLLFAVMGMVWIGIFSTLIAILPEKIGMAISVAVVIGHMAGSATWLAYRLNSYQSCNALFLFTSIAIVTSFNMGRSDTGRTLIDWNRTNVPPWTRWILAAALVALPVWWFLIPH
jgi:hypothetical protein